MAVSVRFRVGGEPGLELPPLLDRGTARAGRQWALSPSRNRGAYTHFPVRHGGIGRDCAVAAVVRAHLS